ncbi:MAG: hypothetical protein HOV80_08440 [Polyangiaceae bacterium]|nr:hypothetical protein [Polyangiaceae bacterium]
MTPSFSIAAIPLWLAPVLLLAIAAALFALGRSDAKSPRWAVFAPLLSLLLLAPGARDAWTGGTVLTLGPRLARVGQADLGLGLALDRTSLVVAAGLTIAWAAALFLATEKQHASSSARALAILAAVLTGVLADGFPTLLLAALVVLLLTPLAADAPRAALGRFFGLASAAVLAVALGSALLFWALGGRWLDGMQYLSDYDARFAIAGAKAEAGQKPDKTATRLGSPTAEGTLTMVSHPGAKIYDGVADEAQLARSVPIAISPAVRVPIMAGLHKIAIAPGDAAVVGGDGLEVALIDVVEIREGKEAVVVIAGPTMTFHEIAPQITSEAAVQVFLKRRLSSVPAAAAIAAAFLASLLLAAFALRERFDGLTGALAGSGLFCVLSIATARVGSLIVTTPAVAVVFAIAAAVSALLWALPALRGSAAPVRTGVLAPIAALGTAAAVTAPVAPASAAAAIALSAAVLAVETPSKKKKKKDKQSAEKQTPSLTSATSLVRAAASGVPIPGGVFVLGAAGVAGAFAGMGAGNALLALTVVVAWIACAAIVWRPASKDVTAGLSPVFGIVALALGLVTAVGLAPWDVPSNATRGVRAALAIVAFGIVTAACLRVRSIAKREGPPPTEPQPEAEPAAALLLVGRTIDRALGAPLDLLTLPFSRRTAARTEPKEPTS